MTFENLKVGKRFYVVDDNGEVYYDTLFKKIELEKSLSGQKRLVGAIFAHMANAKVLNGKSITGGESIVDYLDFIPFDQKVVSEDEFC